MKTMLEISKNKKYDLIDIKNIYKMTCWKIHFCQLVYPKKIKNRDFKQLFESVITNKHLTANTSSPA